MVVARATSSPIRSSMRRSTPFMGEGCHSIWSECITTGLEKSALISMLFLPFVPFMFSALTLNPKVSDYPAIEGRAATFARQAWRLVRDSGMSTFAKSANPRPAKAVMSATEKLSPARNSLSARTLSR